MDKPILELVDDFTQWKGDAYRLASLVAEKQKDLIRDKLIEAGFLEAAELV